MAKKIGAIIFFAAAFSYAFFAIQSARAADIYTNTAYTSQAYFSSTNPFEIGQELGTGLSYHLDTVDMWHYPFNNNDGVQFQLRLWECEDSGYATCSMVASENIGTTSGGGAYAWRQYTAPDYDLLSAKYYIITFYFPGSGSGGVYGTRFSNDNPISGVKAYCTGNSTCASDINSDSDLSWVVSGTETPSGPSISIIRPDNGTSTTNEANLGLFWGISVDPTASSTCSLSTPCRVAVHYWLGTSTEALASPGVLIDFDAIYSTSTVAEKYFAKSFEIANGTWSAAAYLYTGFNYPLTTAASSSVSTFTITGSTVPGGSYSTSTIASSTLECNSGNWFSDGFCGAISWLFYPPTGSLDMYSDLSDSIKNKPPIGYLVSMNNALGNITNGTSSISLMDASTTSAFSGIFGPINTGIAWLLWLALGMWSFKRIKKMEL